MERETGLQNAGEIRRVHIVKTARFRLQILRNETLATPGEIQERFTHGKPPQTAHQRVPGHVPDNIDYDRQQTYCVGPGRYVPAIPVRVQPAAVNWAPPEASGSSKSALVARDALAATASGREGATSSIVASSSAAPRTAPWMVGVEAEAAAIFAPAGSLGGGRTGVWWECFHDIGFVEGGLLVHITRGREGTRTRQSCSRNCRGGCVGFDCDATTGEGGLCNALIHTTGGVRVGWGR